MEAADFIVVGGGVYGASLAYELVNRGSSVTLLEAGELASRASGGPGKRGVRANGRNSRELSLAREALARWPALADELGSDTGFEQLGGLMLVDAMPEHGEIGLARAEAHQRLQRGHGIACEMVDHGELAELEPGIAESQIAALFNPDEGIADQRRTARAYASAARKRGASIRTFTPVRQVGTQPRPYVLLEDGSTLPAGRAIVLAANFGTNALLARSALPRLPQWTMVPQVLMVQAKDDYQPRRLCGHLQKTLAVKPLPDGITMISGGMRGKWDDESAEGQPVDAKIKESLDVAASVFPPLDDGVLLSADASSPETYTPDGLPYLDFHDEDRRLFVATGWHGHGFAIAPAVARHAAQWLTTGRTPDLLTPFRIHANPAGPGKGCHR
ncbi:NAD(P)/FAD-dependent oxidoreductase [Amycolatopsis echigonensis]|uniref:FAD-binding oxidoreductase n=1 Tax=Amycolatopsis echigonensis TaxID=2576905 RepID=A0A8E2B8C2_9PSEU|nr:FAD-binding oxidoreductase [Amycolatopsis echigonensis]MBB2505679.1 FAD-binding oxidoreductase [Amycolatopsis echigonensis]